MKHAASHLLLLLAYLLPGGAYAHLPELYGREYLRIDPGSFSYQPTATVPRRVTPASAEEQHYRDQLQAVESTGGPYHQDLSDPLTDLARYHRRRGELQPAVEAYRRAIYLIRVNDGLYSQRQVPLLLALQELHRDSEDYAALGDSYAYYARVRALARPPFSPEKVDAALQYLDWERELYASRDDGQARLHLLRAFEANRSLLQALAVEPDLYLEAYLRLALSQMRNLYLVLGDEPLESTFGTDSSQTADVNRELAGIQKSALDKGKRLLKECIEKAAAGPATLLATLHLELGDWHQWNGEWRSARREYMRVVELLTEADQPALLAQWLGQPTELPDEPDLWPRLNEIHFRVPLVVEARYEVTPRGEARGLAVKVKDEEGLWQARKIRRMLRETHFRPAFNLEGPRASPPVTRHYRLIAVR